MTIEQSAVFLAATILTGLGFVIATVAIVVINNIVHKYWKSFGWKFFPAYVQETQTQVEPEFKK